MNRQTKPVTSDGFTLVEVLIVMAIIGVLMGLTVVAVNTARRTIQQKAIAIEISALASSIDAYKTKYTSYPPDGSSFVAFQQHFRSAFPNIAQSEFDALSMGRLADGTSSVASTPAAGGIMDPAEALVFCLGGFSTNPTRPFTGPGGPLSEILQTNGSSYSPRRFQYNMSRNEPFFPFAEGTLTLREDASTVTTFSSDEQTFGTGNPDALPVYVPKNRAMPVVYFSSSTYATNTYTGTGVAGVAKPYKSEKRNTSVTYSAATAERFYPFMNDKSFQIISAGLDDDFGGAGLTATQYYTFPSGLLINISSGNNALDNPLANAYQSTAGGISTQLDNATNFADGVLGDSLP